MDLHREGIIREGASLKDTTEPLPALDFAIAQTGPAIFLFKDISSFWGNDPFIIRKLKEFAVRARSKVLIIIGEEEAVPERLREDLVILYQGLPAIAEIKKHLEFLKEHVPQLAQACAANPELMGSLVVAAQGLDFADIERSIRGSVRRSPACARLSVLQRRLRPVFSG